MENILKIKNDYNSLDAVYGFLKSNTTFECSKEYDKWEMRTDENGQMAQCILLKKSSMHAIKLYFTNENTIKVTHVIPSSVMNAYFGKSQEARRNIFEIITGKIKEVLLAPSQKKAFLELESEVRKMAV
mgnify:CR=1 FL=1